MAALHLEGPLAREPVLLVSLRPRARFLVSHTSPVLDPSSSPHSSSLEVRSSSPWGGDEVGRRRGRRRGRRGRVSGRRGRRGGGGRETRYYLMGGGRPGLGHAGPLAGHGDEGLGAVVEGGEGLLHRLLAHLAVVPGRESGLPSSLSQLYYPLVFQCLSVSSV